MKISIMFTNTRESISLNINESYAYSFDTVMPISQECKLVFNLTAKIDVIILP
jgi:hypothetical protein